MNRLALSQKILAIVLVPLLLRVVFILRVVRSLMDLYVAQSGPVHTGLAAR